MTSAFRPVFALALASLALLAGCGKGKSANSPQPPAQTPLTKLFCNPVPGGQPQHVPLENARMRVQLSPLGAGVDSIELLDFRAYHGDTAPYVLLQTPASAMANGLPLPPSYAAAELKVDDAVAALDNRQFWNLLESDASHAVYEAKVLDPQGQPLVDIRRTWTLSSSRDYGLELSQELINRSGRDLKVSFETLAQGDIADDLSAYMTGARKITLGYADQKDPARPKINGVFMDRSSAIKDFSKPEWEREANKKSLWPCADVESASERAATSALGAPARTSLAYFGCYNRFFLLATHAPFTAQAGNEATVPVMEGQFPLVRNEVGLRAAHTGEKVENALALYTFLGSGERQLAKGQTLALPLSVYAGPRDARILAVGNNKTLGLDQTIRYRLFENFCGSCAFSWLTSALKWGLIGFHYVARDWAASIIILVLVIRLLLHPITKRSQISLQRYTKSIAALAPEVDKIKKKITEPMEQQRAIQALYREKGISHTGLLGCLPMFLQMPIWMSLGAVLYYFFPLRESGGAFWGLFQHLSGGRWEFLADLTTTDRFIPFYPADGQHVWNVFFFRFDYSAFNILPLLMGVAMYFTTKASATAPANPDQQMQQTMMRWMSVLLTPLMLYAAPAGFTLYSAASMGAGVIDGWIVRREVKRMEEDGTLLDPKAVQAKAKATFKPSDMPKPGTLKWRIWRQVAFFQAKQQARADGKPVPTWEEFNEAMKMARNFNPNPRGPQAGWQFKNK